MNTEHCEHSGFLGAVLNALILGAILVLLGWIIALPLAVVIFLFARNEGFAAALDHSALVMRAIAALICWSVAALMVIWLAKDFAPIFSNLLTNFADLLKLMPHVVEGVAG